MRCLLLMLTSRSTLPLLRSAEPIARGLAAAGSPGRDRGVAGLLAVGREEVGAQPEGRVVRELDRLLGRQGVAAVMGRARASISAS